MKVVVAGGGSVGRFTAEQLVAAGHKVIVIENDRGVVSTYGKEEEAKGVRWHLGDACDVEVLRMAGVVDAEVVAAVTGDDEDNLVVSLLSKQEFGVPRVVARVNNPKNHWMFNEMWGIDVAVSTPHLITSLVQEAVTVGNFVKLMDIKGGKAELAEVTLAPDSPACNKLLKELKFPRSSTVVAIVRDEIVLVPESDTILRSGDEVMVLINADTEGAIQKILIG
ncbi:MAG: TrkA family potassium uptake protein [Actinobacteria bacterium]|nr:TrkA family potassium uptake protein [Actinomycetota bacterium]